MWLKKLKDLNGQAIIEKRIKRLELGDFGDSKAITNGNGIQELRIHYGGYRVYYIEREEEIIILLVGGDKDSQTRDIEQAKRLAKNY